MRTSSRPPDRRPPTRASAPELSQQPFGRLVAGQDHGHDRRAARIDIRNRLAPRLGEVEVRRSDRQPIGERDGPDTVHSEGASTGRRVREEIPDPGLHGHPERVHGPGGHGPRAPRVPQPDAHPLDDRALEYIQVRRDPWRGSTPASRIEHDGVRGRRGLLAKRLGQRPDQLAQRRLRLGRQPRVRPGDQEQRSRLGCVQAAEVGTAAAEQLPATASTGLCIDGRPAVESDSRSRRAVFTETSSSLASSAAVTRPRACMRRSAATNRSARMSAVYGTKRGRRMATLVRILETDPGTERQGGTMHSETTIPAAPAGYATVNPFIIADDANGLIEFLKQVFSATERPEARTMDADGLLLHAELAIGNATIMFAERKPDWPFTPSLLQVYVDDVVSTLNVARQTRRDGGHRTNRLLRDTFSRFRDPWGNLWWVYRHGGQTSAGDAENADWAGDAVGDRRRGVGADLPRADLHPRHPDDGDAASSGPSAGSVLSRLEASPPRRHPRPRSPSRTPLKAIRTSPTAGVHRDRRALSAFVDSADASVRPAPPRDPRRGQLRPTTPRPRSA